MNRLAFVAALIFIFGQYAIVAQDLSDFYIATKKRSLVIEANYTFLNNKGNNLPADILNPFIENQYKKIEYKTSYLSFAFNFNKGIRKTGKFDFYYTWNWRWFSDWEGFVTLWFMAAVRNDYTKKKKVMNGIITNSFIGFHNFGLNLNGNNKRIFRAGLNISDYQYHLSGTSGGSGYARENGNYTKLGCFTNMDFMIKKNVLLSTDFIFSPLTIAVGYHPYTTDQLQELNDKIFKFGGRTDGVKSPVFYFINLELFFIKGFFIRTEYWGMMNRTDVDLMKRLTIVTGFKIKTGH